MWRKSCKKELLFKIEHEPDNVRDKNALEFLVFHNDNWHIIGYCGINKIPKLKSALHQKQGRQSWGGWGGHVPPNF